MNHSTFVAAGAVALAAVFVAPQAHSTNKAKPPATSTQDMTPPAQMQKTGTKFNADADMQAVLDAHASLNPKPIENLDPAEARKQPTVADAVNVVLKKQGKDTSPTALVPGVTSEDRQIPGAAGVCRRVSTRRAGPAPFRSSCISTAAGG